MDTSDPSVRGAKDGEGKESTFRLSEPHSEETDDFLTEEKYQHVKDLENVQLMLDHKKNGKNDHSMLLGGIPGLVIDARFILAFLAYFPMPESQGLPPMQRSLLQSMCSHMNIGPNLCWEVGLYLAAMDRDELQQMLEDKVTDGELHRSHVSLLWKVMWESKIRESAHNVKGHVNSHVLKIGCRGAPVTPYGPEIHGKTIGLLNLITTLMYDCNDGKPFANDVSQLCGDLATILLAAKRPLTMNLTQSLDIGRIMLQHATAFDGPVFYEFVLHLTTMERNELAKLGTAIVRQFFNCLAKRPKTPAHFFAAITATFLHYSRHINMECHDSLAKGLLYILSTLTREGVERIPSKLQAEGIATFVALYCVMMLDAVKPYTCRGQLLTDVCCMCVTGATKLLLDPSVGELNLFMARTGYDRDTDAAVNWVERVFSDNFSVNQM
jgi:hypothetical protein